MHRRVCRFCRVCQECGLVGRGVVRDPGDVDKPGPRSLIHRNISLFQAAGDGNRVSSIPRVVARRGCKDRGDPLVEVDLPASAHLVHQFLRIRMKLGVCCP